MRGVRGVDADVDAGRCCESEGDSRPPLRLSTDLLCRQGALSKHR